MGVIHSAAVLLLLICSINPLPTESASTDIQAHASENDAQIARKAFAQLTSAQPNNGGADGGTDDVNANSVVDSAVRDLLAILRNQNMERIPIPKFEEEFSKKVGLVRVKGTFRGEDGLLDGVTSIARKGDASVRQEGTTVVFESILGLDLMRLGMKYTAQLKPINVKGNLEAKVHNNIVTCSGGLQFSEGKCALFIKTLDIKEIGKIDINVTGLGPLNWLSSRIVTWVTSRLRNDIRKTVEARMREILDKEMNNLECPPILMPH